MKLKYIESFDGLRGIAILMLMVFHGSYGYFAGGIPRVDLFSIMSGFLITYLLYSEYSKTGTISFKNFYVGRALRLLPALFLCILLANLLWTITPLPAGSDRTITNLASLFYFSNLVIDNYLGNLPHLWSLSVEEHFYFIWPTLSLVLLFKLKDKGRIVFLGVTIAMLEVFRVAAYLNQDAWRSGIFWIDPYGFTLCRIDCMLIGALIFFVVYRDKYNYGAPTPSRYDNIWLGILAVVFVSSGLFLSFSDRLWLEGGFVVTNLVCAAIVVITLRNPTHPVLSHRLVKWLGVRSYGIYLYHLPIFYALEIFRVHHDNVNFLVVSFFRFALSIAFAALSYQFLELPFLRYKSRRKKALTPIGQPLEPNWPLATHPGTLMTVIMNGTVETNGAVTTKSDAPKDTTSLGG
ncbi:MAG TPA: acyltransferase [Chryseolinea sp.]|nr:acyltransferase [Chryseolinea sp.]